MPTMVLLPKHISTFIKTCFTFAMLTKCELLVQDFDIHLHLCLNLSERMNSSTSYHLTVFM